MQTEGASAIFVAIVAVIVGSIVLSGSALLVLREEAPSSATSAAPSATAAEVAASGQSATATGTPSSVATSAGTPVPTGTPSATPRSTRTPTPTPTPASGVEYTVRPGDALDLIAAEFGVASAAIVAENGLVAPYVLEVGQVLVIPVEE
ncbi:MAG: LysM peptidoglycan-binding domain-containing protein [Dehalococcoidia bacterium]